MRTTIDLAEDLMDDLMKASQAKTKRDALEHAIQLYLEHKAVEQLRALL